MAEDSTYIQVMREELKLLFSCLSLLTIEPAKKLAKRFNERLADMGNQAQVDLWNQFRGAAQARARDGELEVDDSALVSESDHGAYVMAWLWVYNEQAGIKTDEGEDE